jgi:hypothetical protein
MVCALCAMPCFVFAQEHEHEEEEAARLQLGLDFVLGLGQRMKEDGELEAERAEAPKPPMVESFLLAASYEVAQHFAVGARFGLSIGDGDASRELEKTTTAFSNVELEGEYETEVGEHTALALSLGVSLPTAQGLISEGDTGPELESAARRLAVQEAASAARGFEDGALFEPGYFGLIPKIALAHHAGALLLEASAKYESLVRVAGGDETSYVGELIPGGFAGYELAKLVTLGVRAWGNIAFQALKESAFVIEPQARAALGPVRLVLGALVPLASRFENPTLGGLRLMAAARF